MKMLLRLLVALFIACSLSACLFQQPVFTDGFSKIDPALGGVWATAREDGDVRKIEFAVCAPLDEERYLLHHPSGGKDGIYYEARLLKVRDRSLLQMRVLATFSDGLPKADAERYTLAWIETEPAAATIRVRALGGDGVKEKGPAAVKRLLEAPSTDWNTLFGEAMVFRRLKDH
jgi:hypothetical protein